MCSSLANTNSFCWADFPEPSGCVYTAEEPLLGLGGAVREIMWKENGNPNLEPKAMTRRELEVGGFLLKEPGMGHWVPNTAYLYRDKYKNNVFAATC